MALPGRVVDTTRISNVFRAQEAFGIAHLGSIFQSCYFSWILFRLGQVDGDLQGPVVAFIVPLKILCYSVYPDIIGFLTQPVEIVGGFPDSAFSLIALNLSIICEGRG